ncbi:NADPH:quinone reductase-like Zn-dependent oxidoreductase [Arthrobacter sp. AG258]|uniref:quinone oxidoreductase family protein n=1 Tax=Arthrobacter sp. AG258 TaxID=2183899 RepID=UPI00105F0784|nr:zinc-binding alcohol dehydrogenase family protein [Arthrobacter sp. AG258]TDT73572.1 NADPH:quinone reductase-like Zn-dependent oxidoreductase [Arthrobacter sp. AG258]
MKTLEMTGPGGPEVMQYSERSVPRPGPHQVTIAVSYAGLNFADVLARRGLPGYTSGWPHIPGLEVGGTVLETGDEVTDIHSGDRVVAFTVNGTGLSEVALAEAALTVKVPLEMDLAAATTVPLTWGTALGLAKASHVGPEDTVLVTSAAGGVGTALATVLKHHGVTTIVGGVGSPEKISALASGYVPVPRDEHFSERVTHISPNGGFDVVLESVGGPVMESAVRMLTAGGRLVSYGAASGHPDPALPSLRDMRTNNATVTGFSIINLARRNPRLANGLIKGVFDMVAAGVTVSTPRMVGWDEAAAAHIAQGEGTQSGKTVVQVCP